MVIKVYTSGISGSKEVKKRQQRIMMILESKNYPYVAIDITEPGNEEDKHFMQENSVAKDSKHPIPPQIFNESQYCGDYVGFDLANENDELEIFLKMPLPPPPPVVNGKHEPSTEKDTSDTQVPERQEELINLMVPTAEEPEKEVEREEDSVHGFCYTPGLAKRLEKALKSRVRKPQKPAVHGYCYTPSLAQRLARAMEQALARKNYANIDLQPVNNDDDQAAEEEEETESIDGENVEDEEEKNGAEEATDEE